MNAFAKIVANMKMLRCVICVRHGRKDTVLKKNNGTNSLVYVSIVLCICRYCSNEATNTR